TYLIPSGNPQDPDTSQQVFLTSVAQSVPPGATVDLPITATACAFETDLFRGSNAVTTPGTAQARYGPNYLDSERGTSSSSCPSPTATPAATATLTATPPPPCGTNAPNDLTGHLTSPTSGTVTN